MLAGWLYLLFLHGLGDRDLWNSHEARAAMNAQTILDDGSWLLPRLYDGRCELQKPPLYYWLVAIVARLRGSRVDAWTVRLPAILSALLCAAVVALLGRASGRTRAGLLAAAVLVTATHFTWLARVGRVDLPLTCAVTVTLANLYLARREGPPRRRLACLAAAYLAAAAAVLLKGPIGIVLPAAAFGTYLLAEGDLPPPWRLRPWAALAHDLGLWWGLPLVLLLTAPWFVAANRATDGELVRVFFWHHNVERGLGGSSLRGHPWWFYAPRLLLDFAPWSLLLPAAVVYFYCRWREDTLARFSLAWLVGMLAVLSCARYKRADYLAPAYPGAALFLGCVLCRWHRERAGRLSRRMVWGTLTIVFVGSAVGWCLRVEVVLPAVEARREHRSFARVIRRHVAPPRPVYFFQTEAHALAFHVGRPVRVLLAWKELERLGEDAGDPGYIVMPADRARVWREFLHNVNLEEVARNTDLNDGEHEKPLVLFRLRPIPRTTGRWSVLPRTASESRPHAGSRKTAADRQTAPEPGAAGTRRRGARADGGAGVGRRAAGAGGGMRDPPGR